jgi:predicted anti-sigma-YlaC factor YlaD
MMWNLNCRKTRRLLALSAGNDLEERELPGVERHLAVCPSCRHVWQRLRHSQQVLERVSAAPVEDRVAPASIWPAVARHVRIIDEQTTQTNWRGWLPAGALAAACLAVVLVALPDDPFSAGVSDQRASIATSPQRFVSGSVGRNPQRMPVTVLPDPDRDSYDFGHEHRPQILEGGDEPRSF